MKDVANESKCREILPEMPYHEAVLRAKLIQDLLGGLIKLFWKKAIFLSSFTIFNAQKALIFNT